MIIHVGLNLLDSRRTDIVQLTHHEKVLKKVICAFFHIPKCIFHVKAHMKDSRYISVTVFLDN